jgi:type IV secretory pathway TrbL component
MLDTIYYYIYHFIVTIYVLTVLLDPSFHAFLKKKIVKDILLTLFLPFSLLVATCLRIYKTLTPSKVVAGIKSTSKAFVDIGRKEKNAKKNNNIVGDRNKKRPFIRESRNNKSSY